MTTQPPTPLDMPVTSLAGVGTKVAEQLAQLGVHRLFDLILHLPRDYEDRSRLAQICTLADGQSALVEGEVVHIDNKGSRGMTVILEDDTGKLSLRFFKGVSWFNSDHVARHTVAGIWRGQN